MVLDLLGGQWESETTTKPRRILELPEEKGRTQGWGGVYTLTTGWTSSGCSWPPSNSFLRTNGPSRDLEGDKRNGKLSPCSSFLGVGNPETGD